MTPLFLAWYFIALDSMTVIKKHCVDNVGPAAYTEAVDTMKGMAGNTCNQHGDAMSTTCVHAGSQTMGRIILLKDKAECENHPERELHNLKVMLKKEYK
jgi:hypothetical protein